MPKSKPLPTFSKASLNSKFKPGEYIITDPCYVFPDEMWSELCDKIFCAGSECKSHGVIRMDGFLIWWGSTAYGDGGYQVKQNGKAIGTFGVDAGLFALIPYDFAVKYAPDFLTREDGIYTKLEITDGLPKFSEGNLECGNVSVITDGSDCEEE